MNGVGLLDARRIETPESATISYLFDIAGTTQEVWFRISARRAANAAVRDVRCADAFAGDETRC